MPSTLNDPLGSSNVKPAKVLLKYMLSRYRVSPEAAPVCLARDHDLTDVRSARQVGQFGQINLEIGPLTDSDLVTVRGVVGHCVL